MIHFPWRVELFVANQSGVFAVLRMIKSRLMKMITENNARKSLTKASKAFAAPH